MEYGFIHFSQELKDYEANENIICIRCHSFRFYTSQKNGMSKMGYPTAIIIIIIRAAIFTTTTKNKKNIADETYVAAISRLIENSFRFYTVEISVRFVMSGSQVFRLLAFSTQLLPLMI